MNNNVVFKISGGKTTFLVSEHTKAFIPANAPIRRASHVEPINLWQAYAFRLLRKLFGDEGRVANWTRDWKCTWVVDMRPIGGEVFFPFKSRAAAIEFEIQHLNKTFLGV